MIMLDRSLKHLANYPLDFLSHFCLLLPALLYFYRREFLNTTLLCAILFFVIRFIEECVLLYYSLTRQNNLSLQKGLLVIDTIIVTELFYLSLKDRLFARQAGLALALSAVFVTVVAYMYSEYSFVGASLFRFLLIFFALAYFNKILAENRILRIVHHPMFWISSAFLIYGMGTFMTSLFTDYLLDSAKTSDQTFDLFWNMGQVLSIIQCILAAISIWVSKFDRLNYVHPI